MITPKKWLVENGHAPKEYMNARGRMPRAYKDLIEAAVLEGAQIEGFALQASTGPAEADTVKSVKPNAGEKIIADVNFRYSEDDYVCREDDTGKLRGMREACRNCGCSVVGCWCPQPLIVKTDGTGSVYVTVERKSGN